MSCISWDGRGHPGVGIPVFSVSCETLLM